MIKSVNAMLKVAFLLVLLVSVATAAEIYNKDDSVLNLNGRIVVGAESGNKAEFDNITDGSYARFNINGSTQINDKLKGFGAVEFNMYFNDPQQINTQNLMFKSRLAYVGLKDENNSISFGKQYSTFYDIGEYTDMFAVNGDSVVSYNFYNFDVYERVNSSAVYRFTYKNLSLGVMGSLSDPDVGKNYQYSGSVQYKFSDTFKIGAAYQYIDYYITPGTQIQDYSNEYIVGFYFENDMFIVSDVITIKNDKIKTKDYGYGSEGYLAYKFNSLGTNIFTGYNFFQYTNILSNDIVPVEYVSLGFSYYFNAKIYTYGEYKYDTRSKAQREDARASDKESSFGLYLRYNI